jgi:excisionase family DNA binding protein
MSAPTAQPGGRRLRTTGRRAEDRGGADGETPKGLPADVTGTPLLITVEEAASMLRLGRTRTYQLVIGGQILSVKLGRRRLVVRKSLQDFVDALISDQNDPFRYLH